MTDPYLDLYFCIINFICGIFFFIIYYGIILIENKKNKYIIYFLDFFAVIISGIIYLIILDSNKIQFNLYFIFFIGLGYFLGFKLFMKQLKISYHITNTIFSYLFNKIKIVLRWLISIPLLNVVIKFIKVRIIKYKIKRVIKKFNNKVVNKNE